MYYPIGWHKVLKLDTFCDEARCEILSVQANHGRELFFILTTRTLHIWSPRPTVEIVCHRRSKESVEKIGLNKSAVWRIDSSVIVVATDGDQLLFYQVRPRISTTSATSFLLPSSSDGDSIYRLHHDSKNLRGIFNSESLQAILSNSSQDDFIPALTLYPFGKLDLSPVGVTCLMSAEEEMIVGTRNGDIYGVHWNGNVDEKFPWSLPRDIQARSDHIIDLKFSSILSGFALVFQSGRVGFMPLIAKNEKQENGFINKQNHETQSQSKVDYLNGIDNAVCTEINHKYRLVAFGLRDSRVVVCSIGDSNSSLVINHELKLQMCKFPQDTSKLDAIKCMRYSPDNFALVTTWEGGHLAIWSVFGSLLFSTQQWQLESESSILVRPLKFQSVSWSKEGYNLWLNTIREEPEESAPSEANGSSQDQDRMKTSLNSFDSFSREEVLIMSIAHCTLSSSPHLTCTSDSIILTSEDKLYVGPSVPHKDKFDHWIVIDIPKSYLNSNYPIRYATVDRECKNLAIAGNKGLALHSIELDKWSFFTKKSHGEGFTTCGDLIWWKDYLVASCFNLIDETFEIRAYLKGETLNIDHVVIQTTPMEVIQMSIFENRLLVLYSDGTMGMFMLNLRRRPAYMRPKLGFIRSNSIVSSSGVSVNGNDEINSPNSPRSTRSDSVMSFSQLSKKSSSLCSDFVLQISPIENLVISNIQANAFCISSIALTRLHFKNNRFDDSILLNACGRLFLLEREAPPDMSASSPTSDLSSNDLKDLSLDSHKSSELEMKVSLAKTHTNSLHLASASLKDNSTEPKALENVTFKAVSVIATNVEQFWISPEISNASEMSYFKKSLWLSCGGPNNFLKVWLPLLNDKNDPPTDLYVNDRIRLTIKCDIYPLAIRSSAPNVIEPDDAIVLGAESDVLYKDCKLFTEFPYMTVKRQCRVYLHRILRELLLEHHLGYYARKIAESCQSLPYFAHCFELLLHEVLEEESTSPVPLPDPMLPRVVRFIKEFPVYLETVVHCARKSEMSMWSYLFDERAVGNPRKLFQECLEKNKLDTAASCLIILQSLDRNIVSQQMVKALIKAASDSPQYKYLINDLESFLLRAELDYMSLSSGGSPNA